MGVVPGHSWQSGGHTNSLIPLYAHGAGAEEFNAMVIGVDSNLVAGYDLGGTGFDGNYIDNTSIYHIMINAITIPEPASLLLLALGLALFRRRAARRRRLEPDPASARLAS